MPYCLILLKIHCTKDNETKIPIKWKSVDLVHLNIQVFSRE